MSQIEAATSYAAGVFCWNWMVCSHKRKNVITWCHPRLEVKTGLRCHLCPTSAGGRHGKSEPRSVGVLANAHGITLLLQRTKHQNHNSTKSFADGSRVKVFWSPSGTFCPKARGLSPQRIWEQAPCVFAAWPCLSCAPKAANSMQHSKSETCKKLLI